MGITVCNQKGFLMHLTVPVLVPAVHPPVLALAVVAGAVGSLDEAGGAVGAVLVTGLGAGRAVHRHQEHEEEGGGGGQGDGGGLGHFFPALRLERTLGLALVFRWWRLEVD